MLKLTKRAILLLPVGLGLFVQSVSPQDFDHIVRFDDPIPQERVLSRNKLYSLRPIDSNALLILKQSASTSTVPVNYIIDDFRIAKGAPPGHKVSFDTVLAAAQKPAKADWQRPLKLYEFLGTEVFPATVEFKGMKSTPKSLKMDSRVAGKLLAWTNQGDSLFIEASYTEVRSVSVSLSTKTFSETPGEVTIGKPFAVMLDDIIKRRGYEPLVPRGTRYVLVDFAFTVPELPNLEQVQFTVRLGGGAISHLLLPERVDQKEEVEQEFNLSAELGFAPVSVKGEAGYKVKFVRLRPVILAFGRRETSFYWIFKKYETQLLPPGAKSITAIIEVPPGEKSVYGQINARANYFWLWKQTAELPRPVVFDIPMR